MSEENNAKVSIILPVGNVGSSLAKCFEDILGQTLNEFEIICIDHGSSDASDNTLNDHRANDERITVIKASDTNLAQARNLGLERATGDWVLFVDQHDSLHANMLSALVETGIQSEAELVIGGFSYVYADIAGEPEIVERIQPEGFAGQLFSVTSEVDFGWANSGFAEHDLTAKLFRRDMIERLGLRFNELTPNFAAAPFTFAAFAASSNVANDVRPFYVHRAPYYRLGSRPVDEYPLEVLDSWKFNQAKLKELGLFAKIERTFVNAALRDLVKALGGFESYSAFETLATELKDHGFNGLGITNRPDGYLLDPSDVDHLSKLLESSAFEYLLFRQIRGRSYRRQIRRAKDQTINQISRRRKQLSGSKTYQRWVKQGRASAVSHEAQ